MTETMEQNSSREAGGHSIGQEIPYIMLNPMVL